MESRSTARRWYRPFACDNSMESHPLLALPFFSRWKPGIARDLTVTLLWNTAFAALFTGLGLLYDPASVTWRFFASNFVIAQCIGSLIHAAFAYANRRWPALREASGLARTLYYTLVPLACVLAGMWLAAGLIGNFRMQRWVLTPEGAGAMTLVSVVITTALLLIFVPRERAARAEAMRAREQAAVAAAERAATIAQMKLLEAQVEPHFLYNTLAHVDALVATDPAAARLMLARLTSLLHAAARSATGASTLASQVEWTRAYLDVLALRMGPRLAWTVDIPPELMDATMPPALLQPLVENAVKHGLEPLIDGGRIAIDARRDRDGLVLTVADTGAGIAATTQRASTGIGLANLRARLATLYGTRAALAIEDNAPRGTRVIVRLPL